MAAELRWHFQAHLSPPLWPRLSPRLSASTILYHVTEPSLRKQDEPDAQAEKNPLSSPNPETMVWSSSRHTDRCLTGKV